MKLSIITVTWNNEAHIAQQIASVQAACGEISYEHIIIDNGSTDETLAVVSSFSHIQLIKNAENKGFAAANNQGVSVSTGEYILFLNPDMELTLGNLKIFLRWMEAHPAVGLASPRLIDPSGAVQRAALPRRFPRTRDLVAQLLKLPHLFPHMLDHYLMADMDTDQEQAVDSVRGACMLLPRTVIDTLGWGFDPRYFIWYEDVDLCREVTEMGLTVMYTPVINVVDLIGQSFAKQESLWKQKQFTRSMRIYMKKWEPWWKWLPVALLRPVAIGIVWFGRMLRK